MNQQDVLKKYFGHVTFRQGQAESIDSILSGRDVFGIMPTGAGKSICYQVPALILEGITLVVSPLISLMKDQVNALVQSGIKAAYLNSSLTAGQYTRVLANARAGAYKIIYVAPERLLTEDFLLLAANMAVAMVTVDEAHCVSQWGQDFRPSYLKIMAFVDRLAYRPVISAFTATATTEVREDIIRILRLKEPLVIVTGFDRKNLSFEVQKPDNKLSALLDILKRNRDKSGIIYCSTRKTVETVCVDLLRRGLSATQYHAGLGNEQRQANQDDFLYDRKTLMIATNAFGMGIDKSNVSFVVHYNMPKNLESYYQEAGRAGRDGEPAECVLLYSAQDVRTNQFLIGTNRDADGDLSVELRQALVQKDQERLKVMTFYCSTSDCLREYILRYFGEHSPNFCGNCSNCTTHFEPVDITIEAQKILSCIVRVSQRDKRFGKSMIADILRGTKNERIQRLELDSLPTYGILAEMPIHRIRSIMDFLVQNGFLALSDGEYPVVSLTGLSAEILRAGKTLEMRLPKELAKTRPKKNQLSKKGQSSVQDDDGLFPALKELRKELAAAAHVPAYIIFTDATLHDMCSRLPQTVEAFQEISGVGKTKAERYGARFTGLVREYLVRHPSGKRKR